MQQVLRAAILSGALLIGLLVGVPLGYIVRNFQEAPTAEQGALSPQK